MSTTKMQGEKLKAICLDRLACIEKTKEDARAEMENSYLKWRNAVKRFLRMRELTRKEARAALETESTFGPYHGIDWIAWRTKFVAENLLKMVENSSDGVVYVSAEDMYDLQ